MPHDSIEVAFDARSRIGEGPYWHAPSQTLYWVDILGQDLHALDAATGAHRSVRVGQKVHALAVARFPWAVCTVHKHGLAWLHLVTGELIAIAHPEPDERRFLLNDGRCDASGNFWFGALSKDATPTSRLFRLDGSLKAECMHTGLNASNGVAFSPDRTRLYVADTFQGIFCFDLRPDGSIAVPKILLPAAKGDACGLPDGMTIDTDGCLWVAMVHGARILRITPDGEVDRTVTLPCTNPLSCTFGGADLKTLYVTSGRAGLSDDELAQEPLAGAVFAVRTGHQGFLEMPFAGPPPKAGDGGL